jgi:hypothetical protein
VLGLGEREGAASRRKTHHITNGTCRFRR